MGMRNLFFIIIIAILLAMPLVSLFRKRLKRSIKFTIIIFSITFAVVAFLQWTFPTWNYPKTTGAYKAVSVNCYYIDYNRFEPYKNNDSNRWLNVTIWYPEHYFGDEHTCPLIVFSHGSFGVKESNVSLYRELTSHGYIVCALDHTYQCLVTTNADGQKIYMDKRYCNQLLRASDKSEESRAKLCELFTEWMNIRMGDIDFIIDTIKVRSSTNDSSDNGIYLLTNISKIGVMGHSMGGAAALGIGRTRTDIGGVIALEAPFMYDVQGIREGGFIFNSEPYPVPLLSVYTDSSWGIIADSPQYAQNYMILNDLNDITEDIYIKGAGHMTLTDLVYSMPTLCLIFGQYLFFDVDEYVRVTMDRYIDFFDRYLKEK
jgi:dienelactone hydrolase